MINAYLIRVHSKTYLRQLIGWDIWKLNTFVIFLYDKITKGDTRDTIKLYEWYNVLIKTLYHGTILILISYKIIAIGCGGSWERKRKYMKKIALFQV